MFFFLSSLINHDLTYKQVFFNFLGNTVANQYFFYCGELSPLPQNAYVPQRSYC